MLRYSETLAKQTFYYAILLEDGKILRVSRSIDSVLGYLQSGITLVAVLVLAIIGIAFFVIQNQTKKAGGTNQYDGSGTPAATCGI